MPHAPRPCVSCTPAPSVCICLTDRDACLGDSTHPGDFSPSLSPGKGSTHSRISRGEIRFIEHLLAKTHLRVQPPTAFSPLNGPLLPTPGFSGLTLRLTLQFTLGFTLCLTLWAHTAAHTAVHTAAHAAAHTMDSGC